MNNKDNQDLFDEKEEKYLKHYFHKLDKSLGVEPETSARLEASFNSKLVNLVNQNNTKSKSLNWKSYSASVAGAFSIGVILARFLLMPAELATKGVGNASPVIIGNNGAQVISVINLDPEKLAIDAISAAYKTDLEITTFKIGDKIQITLKPLRPYSKEQSKVKSILEIKEDLSGEATVIVGTKP